MADTDRVDEIIAQWARERPDLPAAPMALVGRIGRAERALAPLITESHRRFGLNREGFDVLATLRRAGLPYRLSPTELYRWLMLSSGAMTNRIDRLEADGLVERAPDPQDRRGVLVGLTAKGKRLIDDAMTDHVSNEERLLAHVSQADVATLNRILRKLLIGVEGTQS
jgi:DNA-binding MarR family transcriptional regulator